MQGDAATTGAATNASDRVAVVTGGARGIGRSAALALAAAGHAVCVNDTGVAVDGTNPRTEPAETVAAEIVAAGGRALAVTVDARTAAGAHAVVGQVEAWTGRRPNILVHCAGTLRDAMVHRASDEDWAQVLGSHLSVAVELTRAIAATVRAERFGRFVYVGGAAGLVGSVGQAAYVVAKAGLLGLTRALALEMAGRDVSVNYLAPFAYTRMTETIPPVTPALREYLRSAPLATPDDVAPVIAWLCSQDAVGVTGQVFGARGAEVNVWSQPRPAARAVEPAGWEVETLAHRARPELEGRFVPLESEFDLFGAAPTPVTRGAAR